MQATPQDGGWGAGSDVDGESGLIATTDGDTYNYPAEVIEHAFPLAMERNALNVAAGGGAGRRRGGFGTIREFRVLNRHRWLPPGLDRSLRDTSLGRRRRPRRERATASRSCAATASIIRGGRVTNLPLAPGDLVRVTTGNGGGWGDPRERERALVIDDVRDGYISAETCA